MTGRCIVDGIMNLQQFSWIYTYPLRSIFVYEFRLLSPNTDEPQFEIFRHEEMWFVEFYLKVFLFTFEIVLPNRHLLQSCILPSII